MVQLIGSTKRRVRHNVKHNAHNADTHSSPPWAGSPPERANPDAARLHLAERALDGGDARRVRARADLAEEALEVVLLKPLSSGLDALCTNGGRDTCWRSAGAIAVKILMHL